MANMYLTLGPDDLETALKTARGNLLVVDYDETLWLRNSTEEFLSSARPAWVAAGILKTLDKVRPWRLVGGRKGAPIYRDWMRLMAIALLMPWIWTAWRRTAPSRGRRHANARLEGLIANSGAAQVVVLSNGYLKVIGPLQTNTPLMNSRLVASTLRGGARWRKRGKRAIAEAHFSAQELDHATLITDHIHDLDLLERVGNGILCVWPHASYRKAYRPRPTSRKV